MEEAYNEIGSSQPRMYEVSYSVFGLTPQSGYSYGAKTSSIDYGEDGCIYICTRRQWEDFVEIKQGEGIGPQDKPELKAGEHVVRIKNKLFLVLSRNGKLFGKSIHQYDLWTSGLSDVEAIYTMPRLGGDIFKPEAYTHVNCIWEKPAPILDLTRAPVAALLGVDATQLRIKE